MSADTLASRDRARRRAEARAPLARHDVHLVLPPGARVRCGAGPSDAVAAAQRLRAEVAELLAGLRCLRCGEPLTEMSRVPVGGVGWVHATSRADAAKRKVL
jgi:hypothetical protein